MRFGWSGFIQNGARSPCFSKRSKISAPSGAITPKLVDRFILPPICNACDRIPANLAGPCKRVTRVRFPPPARALQWISNAHRLHAAGSIQQERWRRYSGYLSPYPKGVSLRISAHWPAKRKIRASYSTKATLSSTKPPWPVFRCGAGWITYGSRPEGLWKQGFSTPVWSAFEPARPVFYMAHAHATDLFIDHEAVLVRFARPRRARTHRCRIQDDACIQSGQKRLRPTFGLNRKRSQTNEQPIFPRSDDRAGGALCDRHGSGRRDIDHGRHGVIAADFRKPSVSSTEAA